MSISLNSFCQKRKLDLRERHLSEREQEVEHREQRLLTQEDQLRAEREDIFMKLNESASSTFFQQLNSNSVPDLNTPPAIETEKEDAEVSYERHN